MKDQDEKDDFYRETFGYREKKKAPSTAEEDSEHENDSDFGN
jgi:hypothetical protein